MPTAFVQVCLKEGERELAFSDYGIKILVRFRDGQACIGFFVLILNRIFIHMLPGATRAFKGYSEWG